MRTCRRMRSSRSRSSGRRGTRSPAGAPGPPSGSPPPSGPPGTRRWPSTPSSAGWRRGGRHQVLLGVTGSGKTFTVANVVGAARPAGAGPRAEQDPRRPALRRVPGPLPRRTRSSTSSPSTTTTSPRRTSRAPDTFIEKDAQINDRIDRMRHAATKARPHPARRDRGGLRLLHLRPRLPRGVPGLPRGGRRGPDDRPGRAAAPPRRASSTGGTTSSSSAGRSACGGTWWRWCPPTRTSGSCAWSGSGTRSSGSRWWTS